MSLSTEVSLKPSKLSRLTSVEDYITNLHETLVSHILSRLPTKDAVRTSILSKDWRYKWISLYNVAICDTSLKFKWQKTPLVNFVDRVLSHCQHITSLSLELSFSEVVFPNSLLDSTSLRELKLGYLNCIFNVAAKHCAPNLTSLYLSGVVFMNGDPNISTLTLNFPLLETLTIQDCNWLHVKYVEIYAPWLTKFASEPTNREEEYEYSFVLHAPRLAVFRCSYGLPENFILDGSSVVTAFLRSNPMLDNLQLRLDIGLRVGKLLRAFTSLEKLELSSFMAEVCRLGPQLPRLNKLRQLTMGHPGNAEQLLDLLHATPSLKFLDISVGEWVDYDYGVVESVPSCIVSHLEEVLFTGYVWETAQFNLAKFLLQNGQRLRKVSITDLPPEQQNEVKDFLTALRVVHIEFKYIYARGL